MFAFPACGLQRCIPWNYSYRQAVDFVDGVSCHHDLKILKFIPEVRC